MSAENENAASRTKKAYDEIYRTYKSDHDDELTQLNTFVWEPMVIHWVKKLAGDTEGAKVSELGAGEAGIARLILESLKSAQYVGYELSEQAIHHAEERFGNVIRMHQADVLNLTDEQMADLAQSNIVIELFAGPSVGFYELLKVMLKIRAIARSKGLAPPAVIMIDRVNTKNNLEMSQNLFIQAWYFLTMHMYARRRGFRYNAKLGEINARKNRTIFHQAKYRELDDIHAANATGSPREFLRTVKEMLDAAGETEYDLATLADCGILVIT